MPRPKGSKNKIKEIAIPKPLMETGNADFNLKDALPVDMASAAITAEDIALDMELERMAMEEPIPDIEPSLEKPLTKEKSSMEHISDHMEGEYMPARTLNELEQQISIAKRLGCDSVDAEDKVIYHYCGADYSRKLGFFMYKDIKVHFAKEYDTSKARLKQTVEQQQFGNKAK